MAQRVFPARVFGAACCLLLAAVLAGCSPATGRGRQAGEDYYESILLAGAKVGWSRTTRDTVVEDGRPLVRTRNESQLTLTREGQSVTQRIVLTSWETTDGKLVRFESDQDDGTQTARGEVKQGKLVVTRSTLGKEETESHPWGDWGGYFAPQDSLERQPLEPGESRTITSLAPLINKAADTRLEAVGKEPTVLPAGRRELLKIRGTLTLAGSELEMLFWVDEKGKVLKTQMPAIDQVTVRVSKEEALRPVETTSFDLLADTIVNLPPPAPDFGKVRRVDYQARIHTGKIEGVFSEGLSQRVTITLDPKTAYVAVLAVRPGDPQEAAGEIPPTQGEIEPTTLVQSDDAEVRAIAASVAADQTDSWQIAVELERHIDATIREKNYTQAFASAAEVARSLEGDCTEHAVLLAACLRARKIPARVAFGLVYVPSHQGFAYHMWTEAWIEDRWIPLDGTQGRGGIGCDHIKLGHSSLQGADTYTDILKVISVFRQLELSVVSAE